MQMNQEHDSPEFWQAGKHTGSWWENAKETRDRITALPFLAELGSGSLDPAVFVDYISQDTFYLSNYSRALSTLASRAPTAQAAQFWAGCAHSAVEAERGLHQSLMADPILEGYPRPTAPSPTTRGYMYSILAACGYESYEVGAASVLACFWIYAKAGLDLASRFEKSTAHPYARWVREYGRPEFITSTRQAIEFVEQAASTASAASQKRMREVFLECTRWEELFWSAVHSHEEWKN